jgi:hypothetical protein
MLVCKTNYTGSNPVGSSTIFLNSVMVSTTVFEAVGRGSNPF